MLSAKHSTEGGRKIADVCKSLILGADALAQSGKSANEPGARCLTLRGRARWVFLSARGCTQLKKSAI